MIEKYLIAGFVFEINYNGDSVVKDKLSAYKDDGARVSSDFKITINYSAECIKAKMKNITKVSDGLYFYTTKDSEVLFYYDANISKVIAKIEFSADYKEASVSLYELQKNHGVEDSQLAYNVLGTVFSYVIQMHGGFVFHSSSVCYNNRGVAFSAKSGTGKSTHTNLWLQQFNECFVLNDDTPVIHSGADGKFYISGTPWAGTTGINRNVTVPLKAIVFLERSAENSMEQISASDAMNSMFEGIRTPLTVKMLTYVIDSFNKMFAQVPVYKLKCNMDPSAAFLSQKTIFGNTEI